MEITKAPFKKFGPGDIPRPWLPAVIINPHTNKEIEIYGLIDTCADECALPAQYAPLIGHNLQAGFPKEINTGNGKTLAYSHTITIKIHDFVIKDVLIDFMPNLSVPLLGVKSFLSNFVVTIDYPNFNFSLKSK